MTPPRGVVTILPRRRASRSRSGDSINPQAILDALAGGWFYSSTGITLERAEVDNGELVVEIAKGETRSHAIAFVEDGKVVAQVKARSSCAAAAGYLRATVTRSDGKKAWIQPARR